MLHRRLAAMAVFLIVIPFSLLTDSSAQVTPVNGGPLPSGDEVILDYKGHQILVEPEKGPVQGIIIEKVDNLDGSTVEGVIIIETRDGWVIADENFLTDADGAFANTNIAQGFHIVMEPAADE